MTSVVLVLLVEPRSHVLGIPWAPVAVVAAAAAYLARRRILDAALFGAAHLLCFFLVEPVAGPQLLACFSFTLVALSARPRFALFVGCSLVALLQFSTALKLRFGGSLLTWQDVRYFFVQFSDNVGVMATQPTLVAYATVALLAFALGAASVWRLDGKARDPVQPQTGARSVGWVLPMLVVLWCGSALDDTAQAFTHKSAWDFSESPDATPVSTFLSTLYLEPKANYHKVDTAQFARDAKGVAGRTGMERKADIVVFLQESQFNPAAINSCPAQLCNFRVFGASSGTTDHGEMRVHTYGGGTWLTEFALANGVPHRLFGRAGEFASFNVAPGVSRSFIRSLKAAGYHTVAVYPVRGGMMNARMAYRAYGFDEFYDSEDLGLPGIFDTPDKLVHEAAVKVLRSAQKHGKPVYLLALTIFNHSQHGIRMERVPADMVVAARKVFPATVEAENLADYVWRTREFERTYEKTHEAILGADRPSVLAWFGDHQPPFGNAPEVRKSITSFSTASEVPRQSLTWYNVASNLPQRTGDRNPRPLDIVFLPGLLAQRAGVPLDDWLAANVLARERCAGLLPECREPGVRDAYLSYLLEDLRSIQ